MKATNPTPSPAAVKAAARICESLECGGTEADCTWKEHFAVLIDLALADERKAVEEMVRLVLQAATECGGNGDIYEIRRLVILSLHEALAYRLARGLGEK